MTNGAISDPAADYYCCVLSYLPIGLLKIPILLIFRSSSMVNSKD